MRLQVGLAALAFATTTGAEAQDQSQSQVQPRFEVSESYDKFENESTVSLLLEEPLFENKTTTLYLMALQGYKGPRTENQRKDLTFVLANINPKIRLRYGSNHAVNFLADGKRIKTQSKYDVKPGDKVVSEQILFRIDEDEFPTLVDAKEVQVKVGPDIITLNAEHLNGLKWLKYYRDNPQVPIPKKPAKP